MKYVQLKVYLFIFFLIMLVPLNAPAEMGDKASKKWPQLFKQVRLIEEHINNLEIIQIKGLQNQLEDLLRQIEEIKQTFPQLQNVVELNKSETLVQVNKIKTKIIDLEAELKNQVIYKIDQQKKILDNIREDQKNLKLGLAQDIERFEKLNKENFQTQISQQIKILNNIREDQQKLKLALAQDIEKFEKRNKENFQSFALGNKSNLETIAQKLDSLDEATIKNFEGIKGLFISQLIPTIKDNQAKVHDDLLASRKTNDQALKRFSDENQKLSKELSSILRENLIQSVDTKNQADEKINKLAETMKSLQVQHFTSSATLEALKKDLIKAQEFDQLADEKINKLIKNSTQLTVHTNQLEKTVINEMQQSLDKADSSQDKINLANERLSLLIEILKAIAKEQDKLAQVVKVQSGLNKAQAGLIKNQESIKQALADLRRKANVSLSKSDDIKKTLGAMKKK